MLDFKFFKHDWTKRKNEKEKSDTLTYYKKQLHLIKHEQKFQNFWKQMKRKILILNKKADF
jgi:hypothetical protein